MCSSRLWPSVRLIAGHRLVEQQQPGAGHERARQLEQLALTAGERAGILLRQGCEIEQVEQLEGLGSHLALASSGGAGTQQKTGVPAVRCGQ
jgi:hypothetical protein